MARTYPPNELGDDSLHRELSDLGIVAAQVTTKYLMMTLQVLGAAADLTRQYAYSGAAYPNSK
jgi:hypothetical protein